MTTTASTFVLATGITVDCDGTGYHPVVLIVDRPEGLGLTSDLVDALAEATAGRHGDSGSTRARTFRDEARLREALEDAERGSYFCATYLLQTREDAEALLWGEAPQALYITDEGWHVPAEGNGPGSGFGDTAAAVDEARRRLAA